MPIDIFAHSHETHLATLSNARFRYDVKKEILLLFIDRGPEVPPNWVKCLKIEVTDDRGDHRTELSPQAYDLDGSTITLIMPCPKRFQPGDFSQDFVPVGEIFLTADGHERRLPNGSSLARFKAR